MNQVNFFRLDSRANDNLNDLAYLVPPPGDDSGFLQGGRYPRLLACRHDADEDQISFIECHGPSVLGRPCYICLGRTSL